MEQDIRGLKVGDVMQTEWPTLGPEDTVEDAIRLFAKSGISGAPVVEGGELIGIITEGDLIFRDAEIRSPGFLDILGGIVPLGDWEEYQQEVLKSAGVTVREVMTEEVTTISTEASLSEAATIMAEERRKLLPVAGERRLYGVLSRMDILTLHILNPQK
ncbi:MAG: CBS domain-containing protein [Actinomycetota bacterium]|nr:CBS domain-containing protein [Actinomycetota bacterium]HZY65145.1 CBS domain-containing protein [Rubrobacteraceae bacterium]